MIHPVFITMAKNPGLFLEHASAYSDLASAEVDVLTGDLKHRSVLTVASVLLGLLGLGLAGAAGLLAAALPLADMPQPWLLVAIPLVPLLASAALAWRLRQHPSRAAFEALRLQVAQDIATLKILDEE